MMAGVREVVSLSVETLKDSPQEERHIHYCPVPKMPTNIDPHLKKHLLQTKMETEAKLTKDRMCTFLKSSVP